MPDALLDAQPTVSKHCRQMTTATVSETLDALPAPSIQKVFFLNTWIGTQPTLEWLQKRRLIK